ncbi:MAG: hypothetical protein QM776_06800 [Rhodocyclaceae bacterium]
MIDRFLILEFLNAAGKCIAENHASTPKMTRPERILQPTYTPKMQKLHCHVAMRAWLSQRESWRAALIAAGAFLLATA